MFEMFVYFFPALANTCCSSVHPSPAEGWLQRVVVLGTETHVIEEIQLFETQQPVDSLTISHSKVRRTGGAGDLESLSTPHGCVGGADWGCESRKWGFSVALWGLF